MPTTEIEKALRRIEKLETQLREARADLRRAIRDAYEKQEANISQLAKRVGVSRTRIRQLLGLDDSG